ncbi:beta-1,3-glucan-binding protein-like isoform X2 [Periplaneta americana]|uniref:beta-1,3-glucan-binding protein-like isoform X2 n=1 Tax=Periplaneta americana TaxID=6978 RepID=UPI0037E84CCC
MPMETSPKEISDMVGPFGFVAATSLLLLLLGQPGSPESLVWSDEFDTFNLNEWSHLVTAWDGGNREFQYYRNDRRNSYVKDGVLYIKPTWTSAEYGDDFLYNGQLSYPDCNMDPCVSSSGQDIVHPLQSARIGSSFSFKYGRVEVRAKLPKGDWLWPAIWMLPKNWVYGDWPRSGEIDIMESKGNANYYDGNGVSQGVDTMGSTLHWGPDASHNGYAKTHWGKSLQGTGKDFADDFHLFGMEWHDNHLNFSVDNQQIGIVWAPQNGFWYYGGFENNPGGTNIWQNGNWMAPFDQTFSFVINVAVGGNFFPEGLGNRPWSWDGHPQRDFWERRSEWLPTWHEEGAALKIDYIRVYK